MLRAVLAMASIAVAFTTAAAETAILDCRSTLSAPFGGHSDIIDQKVLPLFENPKVQSAAKEIAQTLKGEPVTPEDIASGQQSLLRFSNKFKTMLMAKLGLKPWDTLSGWLTFDAMVSCFPELRTTMQEFASRVKGDMAIARNRQEEQEAQVRRQIAEQEEHDRKRGYQRISVETFVLDGRDLASKAAKVSLGGVYLREGNFDFLYANTQAVMMATRRGLQQPNVPLLTDDASRELRQYLLRCQSNPNSARMGCSVTVLGRVSTCTFINAFGARRVEPCIAVEDGRQ